MTLIQCSGKAHPNASKNRAVENCREFIELESPAPGFRFLCRHCSPVAPPPSNAFGGKQCDKQMNRAGMPEGTKHIVNQGSNRRQARPAQSPKWIT
jgi:hypothetical protein